MFRSVARWFSTKKEAPRQIRRMWRRVPVLEPLDRRDLPSAGVRASLGRLLIEGTNQSDVVVVTRVDQNVVVNFNGVESSFAAGGINSIHFRGRGGDDQFTNNTDITAVARGDAGNDRLQGGSAGDRLAGDDGADWIRGGGGNDVIQGGRGNDDLGGDDGNDKLSGEAGDDRLSGGSGDDRLSGGSGRDDLFGDDGNDVLAGGLGDDNLHGGAGDDRLSGDDGNDHLAGDDGADHIRGGRGLDDSLRDDRDFSDDSEKGKGDGNTSDITENENNGSKALADRFSLDAGGLATLRGTSLNKDDKDFFVFKATSSGLLNVQVLTTNGRFAQLEIETAAGLQVFETQPNDGMNSGSVNITAGTTYFIRLRAKDTLAAGYEVRLALGA
jgi:Ca2+-binding RTX toxin-like protein